MFFFRFAVLLLLTAQIHTYKLLYQLRSFTEETYSVYNFRDAELYQIINRREIADLNSSSVIAEINRNQRARMFPEWVVVIFNTVLTVKLINTNTFIALFTDDTGSIIQLDIRPSNAAEMTTEICFNVSMEYDGSLLARITRKQDWIHTHEWMLEIGDERAEVLFVAITSILDEYFSGQYNVTPQVGRKTRSKRQATRGESML